MKHLPCTVNIPKYAEMYTQSECCLEYGDEEHFATCRHYVIEMYNKYYYNVCNMSSVVGFLDLFRNNATVLCTTRLLLPVYNDCILLT